MFEGGRREKRLRREEQGVCWRGSHKARGAEIFLLRVQSLSCAKCLQKVPRTAQRKGASDCAMWRPGLIHLESHRDRR